MKIINTKYHLRQLVASIKNQGKSIGFVPTMGALHKGHLSLVSRSLNETEFTVVSVFVNPTQFNNKQDLQNYPRDLNEDLRLLSPLLREEDIVFNPPEVEMYPEPDTRQFNFGFIEQVLEGRYRPGHFNGVGQIVSKFFYLVEPDKAYFGEKDFQQLCIIKKMVEDDVSFKGIEIVPCPIVREGDGLAMSSRNTLLSPEQRRNAPVIYKSLCMGLELASTCSVYEVKRMVVAKINENKLCEVEYFEIVNALTLKSIDSWDDKQTAHGCIAVKMGQVRLIDNIKFSATNFQFA